MPAYKDKAKGTWYASFYYEDWTGKKVKKMKRGFPTKREALEWERTFLQQQTADLEMTFENFVAVYVADMKGRIKENTWGTKEHILYKKLVPYFGKRKMCDIHSKEVIAWQNEMLNYRDKNGKPYSPVYLKTLHNQLSAVFNHAVRHYNLKVNPAAQAGNMGKPKGREMLFWTKAEYLKFAEAMMDKPLSYYAFEMLYWCGVREGELLALTPGDFDFEKQTVTISKSYQRIKGKDVITDPKTPKSNRVIQMPAFLCEEMRDYIKSLYGVKSTDRIFTVTKSYLHREMDRGAKEAGVKRIRMKQFADKNGVCLLLVHHTRKQQAGDKFEMISGTTGLLGCADGAFLLQKEKRTDLNATLEIVGRDQPDQKLHLTRDAEKLTWQLDHAETELWKKPPDPLMSKLAAVIAGDTPVWSGSATELVALLGEDIQPNILTRRLNVKAGELLNEHGIEYTVKRTRSGSFISLARKAV